MFEDMVSEPLPTVSVIICRVLLQDVMQDMFKLYTEVRLRVYVDDIKLHVREKNKELVATKKELRTLEGKLR